MKNKRLLVIFGLAAMLLSCTVEPMFETMTEVDRIPLNIDGSIDQVATRATAQGFVDKDAVGLFAVNYLENNTIAGTLAASGNQADNVKYVFDEASFKWVPVKPVYYKDINTNVDLYLYYPYEGSIQDVNAANFEVKKDQSTAETATELSGYEASDWMWGKAEGITPSESRVRIPLNHKLSAVQVTLSEGTGFEEGEFVALSKGVIVTNTTRKAQLDFATGTVTPIGNPQMDGIVMCPQTDGIFRAVVIPQTVDAGTQLFVITVNGISYSFKQNDPVTYQQGKQLSVTINIKKKTPAGDYELELAESQIVAWTEDLNTHGGEARQYFVVNVETPGTLGDVIASMGKNPAKIRNLKVTGSVNANDFNFMRNTMTILEAVNMKEASLESINYIIPASAFREKKTLTKFVFPERVLEIGKEAFYKSYLSGVLSLPDMVTKISDSAFNSTYITSILFPESLTEIGESAFADCTNLTGELLFPSGLRSIGSFAFSSCGGLSGHLHLPDYLETIGQETFRSSGKFTGDLVIPERVVSIGSWAFSGSSFTGSLDLSNTQELGLSSFFQCGFSGALIIPEGVTEIPTRCFAFNSFSSVRFPSTLKNIGTSAFQITRGEGLTSPITFPEGLLSIGSDAFSGNANIPSIHFPSTLQSISENSFKGCYNVSSITCDAIEPPTVSSGAFAGIAMDSFTVGVPSQSVKRYQSELGWSDFKRIAAHYDFSLSKRRIRALDGSISRTYTLRAPSGFLWSVESPDWISVTPSSGIGKEDVVITVSEMTPSDVSSFEINEGTFNKPSYKNYDGRSGEIVFTLNEKDYTFSVVVEQYHYAYPDGHVQTLQTASHGPGIDIVIIGDGYDALDFAKGAFLANAEAGYGHFFDVEPYKTYKDYFNVYTVTALSDESGIGTVNTIIDNKFGSSFTQNRILLQSEDEVFAWAKKADISMDLTKSLVILLLNSSSYEGVTYLYTDGSALACCPVSTQVYPYDFRGIIQHEAGGHGFGKLGDEYIYHNAFVQNCICRDGCEHPQWDDDMHTSYGLMKSLGWHKNLSMTSDVHRVPWAHLIYHPQYSNYVDMYEGGYMHTRGMYRSEATSCMNNNIPYYSAISRQAIVERIKYCAGEEFSLEDFYANDDDSFGPFTRSGGKYTIDRTFGVDPHLNHATGHGPILVGEHPNVK